jgi:hypothetical protein
MSKTFTTNDCFDLIEFVTDLPNHELAAQAAQSLAFRLDLLVQSSTRAIFKSLRQTEFDKLDPELQTNEHLAEIEASFREVEYAERAFAEQGGTLTGPVRTVQDLMNLRPQINALAQDLTALTTDWNGNPRSYVPAELEELFLARPDLRISQTEQARNRMVAEQMKQHGMLPQDMDLSSVIKMDEERRRDELSRIADVMHRQSPIVYMIFELAQQNVVEEPAAHFWHLDLAAQRQMIESVHGAIQRELERAKSNRRLSTMDFMSVVGVAMTAIKKLDEVLVSPRFVREQAPV